LIPLFNTNILKSYIQPALVDGGAK